MDDLSARDRSYDVRRTVPTGSRVTPVESVKWSVRRAGTNGLTADSYDRGLLEPGSVAVIKHYTNAGFRGIECTIQLPDGRLAHGISAGYFTPVQ